MHRVSPSCRFRLPGAILISLFTLVACEDAPDVPPLGGALHHDFGEVDFAGPQMAVEHTFVLTNVTRRPLEIEKLAPTCGCIETRADANTIAPNGQVRIATAMTMSEPGRKREHIDILFKNRDAPLRLELESTARLVIELKALEPKVTCTSREKGMLTLQAQTTIADWPPPSPHYNDIFEVTIDFEGWKAVKSGRPYVFLWQAVLRFTPGGFQGPDVTYDPDQPNLAGSDTITIRTGASNEIQVPLEVKP